MRNTKQNATTSQGGHTHRDPMPCAAPAGGPRRRCAQDQSADAEVCAERPSRAKKPERPGRVKIGRRAQKEAAPVHLLSVVSAV